MTPKSEIKSEQIRELISELTGIDSEDLGNTVRLKEVLEAPERTELCEELETRFSVLVEEQDLSRLKTIGKLLAFISAQSPEDEEEEEEEKPYRKFTVRKEED